MNDFSGQLVDEEKVDDGLKTHITESWETTDGRRFENLTEASEHQRSINRRANMNLWMDNNREYIVDWLKTARPKVIAPHKVNRLVDLIMLWEHRER